MGAGGRYEQLALGATPNVAARIQALATRDTVAISATTWRLVEGYFTAEDLGLHDLKGVSMPMQMHRILGESGAQGLRAVQHPGVACLTNVASVLWLPGYPEQALQKSREALRLAQELAHPFSLTFASYFAAELHQYRHEWQRARELTEAAITLARAQGFPFWVVLGTVLQGWSLAEQGQQKEGLAQMHQSLAVVQATGAEIARPRFLTLLAEVCGKVGQVEAGLSALTEALAAVESTQERCYAAEVHRLQGELLLQQPLPDTHQAAACSRLIPTLVNWCT
jgi:ATP/maltotriose-dependent transcriptional regulator MalT